jgi:hypothetical protein
MYSTCALANLGHSQGSAADHTRIPGSGRLDHMTFVQVHTASLAWAPFIAGCEKAGNRLRPVGVDRTNAKT